MSSKNGNSAAYMDTAYGYASSSKSSSSSSSSNSTSNSSTLSHIAAIAATVTASNVTGYNQSASIEGDGPGPVLTITSSAVDAQNFAKEQHELLPLLLAINILIVVVFVCLLIVYRDRLNGSTESSSNEGVYYSGGGGEESHAAAAVDRASVAIRSSNNNGTEEKRLRDAAQRRIHLANYYYEFLQPYSMILTTDDIVDVVEDSDRSPEATDLDHHDVEQGIKAQHRKSALHLPDENDRKKPKQDHPQDDCDEENPPIVCTGRRRIGDEMCTICLKRYQVHECICWSAAATGDTALPTNHADGCIHHRTTTCCHPSHTSDRGCPHVFHVECIVTWLSLDNTGCPICRQAFVPLVEDMDPNQKQLTMTALQPPARDPRHHRHYHHQHDDNDVNDDELLDPTITDVSSSTDEEEIPIVEAETEVQHGHAHHHQVETNHVGTTAAAATATAGRADLAPPAQEEYATTRDIAIDTNTPGLVFVQGEKDDEESADENWDTSEEQILYEL